MNLLQIVTSMAFADHLALIWYLCWNHHGPTSTVESVLLCCVSYPCLLPLSFSLSFFSSLKTGFLPSPSAMPVLLSMMWRYERWQSIARCFFPVFFPLGYINQQIVWAVVSVLSLLSTMVPTTESVQKECNVLLKWKDDLMSPQQS